MGEGHGVPVFCAKGRETVFWGLDATKTLYFFIISPYNIHIKTVLSEAIMVKLLKWQDMTEAEQALAPFVQGLLNRKGRTVYVDIDHYLDYLDEAYEPCTLWELIAQNKDAFDGAVCYNLDSEDVSINMAATISAAYDLLGVPRVLIEKVNALGIRTVSDLSAVTGDRAQRQRVVFEAVKDRLSRTALVHQVVRADNFHLMLRDFSICNRWACIYTDQSDSDRAFRNQVLQFLDKNIPVYGWTDDEISFVNDVSTYGDYVIPMDWSSNHSYLGQCKCTIRQSVKRTPIAENKHYLALVVSDGDNIQWLEREFSTTSTFGQRQRSPMDYKMSWTFSPSLAKLCPTVAKKIFATEKSDYFISGVSGIGYANMLAYPIEHLDAFTTQTAEAMADSDLEVVCLLDDVHNTENAQSVAQRLSYYTRFPNIKGGIWELDPSYYEGGRGKIFTAMGKPFLSVKHSFWQKDLTKTSVTQAWIDNFVRGINALPVAPDSDAGYTVLNIHPWTITAENIDYFVSKLQDHIELVYADELIDLYRENVMKKRMEP